MPEYTKAGQFLRTIGGSLSPQFAAQMRQEEQLAQQQAQFDIRTEEGRKGMVADFIAMSLKNPNLTDEDKMQLQQAWNNAGLPDVPMIGAAPKAAADPEIVKLQKQRADLQLLPDSPAKTTRISEIEARINKLSTFSKTPQTQTIFKEADKAKGKIVDRKEKLANEQGNTGLNTWRRIDELDHLSQNITTGRFSEVKLEAAKILRSIGQETLAAQISNAPDAEAFRKVAGSGVLEGLKQFELYPVSNVDLKEVKSIYPSLTTGEEANRFVMRSLKEGAFGKIMQMRAYNDAIVNNDDANGILKDMNKWDKILSSPSFRRIYISKNNNPLWFHEFYEQMMAKNPNLEFANIVSSWQKMTKR